MYSRMRAHNKFHNPHDYWLGAKAQLWVQFYDGESVPLPELQAMKNSWGDCMEGMTRLAAERYCANEAVVDSGQELTRIAGHVGA